MGSAEGIVDVPVFPPKRCDRANRQWRTEKCSARPMPATPPLRPITASLPASKPPLAVLCGRIILPSIPRLPC